MIKQMTIPTTTFQPFVVSVEHKHKEMNRFAIFNVTLNFNGFENTFELSVISSKLRAPNHSCRTSISYSEIREFNSNAIVDCVTTEYAKAILDEKCQFMTITNLFLTQFILE